jgi:hypothetical protein
VNFNDQYVFPIVKWSRGIRIFLRLAVTSDECVIASVTMVTSFALAAGLTTSA